MAGKFVKNYYVFANLQDVSGTYAEYGTLEEASLAYKALPSDKRKGLGVNKMPNPMPGALDFIHCVDGEDRLVDDYRKVPGWDNGEIAGVVAALWSLIRPAGWLG